MALDQQTLSIAVVLLGAAVVALGIWVAMLQRSAGALRRRLRAVFKGAGEQGLDEILDGLLRDTQSTAARVDALSSLLKDLEVLARRAVQRVGVVRFNPFTDAGGDQSFAVALLDAEGNGLVISSLHGRTETRLFAKAVAGGRSRHALSAEEQEAIEQALAPGRR